jgi:ComF family protein
MCAAGLNRFDAAYTFGFFEGVLRELIHLLKYSRIQPLAPKLGALLSRAVPRGQQFDLVTPMPLHWWRKWRRGFNQAELLAREVARRTGVSFADVVRRKKLTRSQAGLASAARRRNVAGAFRVSVPDAVRGRRVLLVDDVLTTGATANACAAALKDAGARFVAILTLARADRRRWVESALVTSPVAKSQNVHSKIPATISGRGSTEMPPSLHTGVSR